MAVNLSPFAGVGAQLFNNNGIILAGGQIYTYAAGTTTPATTYTSGAGNIAHSNPIILDAAGRVPTGEVWLSDGQSYKFVVKDADGNLIATYDNLSGINSNFVAYTSQQEIQTATAGQTVFTLTTMQYQPGTNNLTVYVDGVNQYGPGAQYAYVETSSNVVTFENGLHVGALVKFTTAQQVSSGVTTASNVTYMLNVLNAVQTNVQLKLQQTINVLDFIPVGTNTATTDCTLYIQSAFDNIPLGTTLYFPPQTFKVTPQTSSYCLNISRNINIVGSQGGKTQIIASNTNAGHSVLRYAITDNGGFGDVRNPLIHGIGVGFTTTGNHGLLIDQGTVGPINLQITSCNLSAGSAGKALYFNGVSQFSSVFFNQIENGIEFAGNSGDGQRICYNNIFGTNCGIVFRTGNGTYSHLIQSNSITCQNGAIDIPYSAQVKICYNQMEQVGVNAGGYNSMLVIEDGFGIDVIGNNFGGGANVNQNVTIVSATQVVFRDNVFIRTAAYDFNFTVASSNNKVDYNRFLGNRVGLDPNWPAVIADTGTNNMYPGQMQTYKYTSYTPTVGLNGAVATVTYSVQTGTYMRIFNTVFFTVTINTATWTHSGTTQEVIVSLPIAPPSGQTVGFNGSINFTKAGYSQSSGLIVSSSYANSMLFKLTGSGQTPAIMTASDAPSGTNLQITVNGSYQVYG